MNIEVISCTTVKATLTKEDLKDFELSYKLLDQNSLNTQMLLLYIIDEIKIREGIDLSDQKIYIEIFPVKDSGCLFYFSAIDESDLKKEEKNSIKQISALSSDINKIKIMSYHLYSKVNNSFIINSELYCSEKYFYIIIHTFSEKSFSVKSIVSEYCQIIGDDDIYPALIKEHYQCISGNNALKKLAELQ